MTYLELLQALNLNIEVYTYKKYYNTYTGAIVSGENTYKNRDLIKAIGGKWCHSDKTWNIQLKEIDGVDYCDIIGRHILYKYFSIDTQEVSTEWLPARFIKTIGITTEIVIPQ